MADGNNDAKQFLEELLNEVGIRAEIDDDEKLREDQFTEIVIEQLVDAEELDDGELCYHRGHGLKVNGYHLSEDGDCLDLFVTVCSLDGSVENLPKPDVDTAFKRLTTFLVKSMDSYHRSLEEASDAFSLAYLISEVAKQLTRTRLYLFSDRISRIDAIPNTEIEGVEVSYHVWDLERLRRCAVSGQHREPIEIDCIETFGKPLACLPAKSVSKDYSCYLAVVTGRHLVELYSRFGPRLLERNVRCFLQARGNVNKAIRTTIKDQPQRFLAYNNGLSATAMAVETAPLENGGLGITRIRDFQIINGGQTTGSIYNAARKDGASVDSVAVPMKLTVLPTSSVIDELAPLISRYANSQNRVSTADFSSNHPFHVKIEELSRNVWAPAAEGKQRQTHWFYERSRGQYLDQKSRETTRAKKRVYEETNPSRQKFAKTDLAKFENSWAQLPHIVSRGAQKNFAEYMLMLDRRGSIDVDEAYFQRLIAKAILFRQTERIVSAQKFGGYRANIVTYTIALLAHKTAHRIDLDRIWREQALTSALTEFIERHCHDVHHHITSPPGGQNITEWCKKPGCWHKLRDFEVAIPGTLSKELISTGKVEKAEVDIGLETVTSEEKELIAKIACVPADTWFALSKWAKETNNLQGWQRGLAYSLGRRAGEGREPSRKQAIQGEKILEEAESLGFSVKT